MIFDTIDYLQYGTARQQEAFAILTEHRVLHKLTPFDPILAGTIPINIDIETSDLDIICYWTDKAAFYKAVLAGFEMEFAFRIQESTVPGREVVIANCRIGSFEIEIFGQNVPTRHQMAYRHMLIEHKLLEEHGETFRQAIVELKRSGYKTEPSFAKLLDIQGDPYEGLLLFD